MPKKAVTLRFFNIHSVEKYQKIEGGHFGEKNFSKKKSDRAKNILQV